MPIFKEKKVVKKATIIMHQIIIYKYILYKYFSFKIRFDMNVFLLHMIRIYYL